MNHAPRGLDIKRAGQSIECVRTRQNEIHLVSSGDGTEVWRQVIQPGGRFTITPAEDWTALEFLHIIEGQLLAESSTFKMKLRPGDSVSARWLEEAVRFTATTTCTILYICSQPTFHQVSRIGRELTEMAMSVEDKDGYTAEHCQRVKDMSVATADILGMTMMTKTLLGYAGFLHDVGKVKVPASILGKPGPLTSDEWEIMRKHPTFGREMLEDSFLRDAGLIIEQHHERLDGSGYPFGLRHDEVIAEAQIIAVADTYDAMTTDRPYRKALPHDAALEEIEKGRGKLWTREIGDAFLSLMEQNKGITESLAK